ncbi:MAG: hypothetical protein QOD89_1937 [Bradyrhizobium sp.]|jgi:hypothetical protein|nr:hypothetical protein [Bradyrhizobium sp.]
MPDSPRGTVERPTEISGVAWDKIQEVLAEQAEDRHAVAFEERAEARPKISIPILTEYRLKRRELERLWSAMTPRLRLRVTDYWTLTAQVLCLACFVAWGLSFPIGPLKNFALISEAFAQAQPVVRMFDPKPYIHLTIFLMLFGAFALSVWVSYFSDSEKSADHASTVAKTLLGFFIGTATNYLGIAAPA